MAYKLTPEFLTEIAEQAKALTRDGPSYAEDLSKKYGVAKATVRRWVFTATKAGLIESPGHGAHLGKMKCPTCNARGYVDRVPLVRSKDSLDFKQLEELDY